MSHAPRRSQITRLTGLLLAVPFLLLSLVAPGVMPSRGADGGLVMVICSGHGPVEIAVDAATGQPLPDGADAPDQGPDKAPQDGRCAWAQSVAAALPMPAPALSMPARLVRSDPPALPGPAWRPAHDPQRPLPRGPPGFA